MLLLTTLTLLPARISHALLGQFRLGLDLISTSSDALNDERSKIYTLVAQIHDLTPNAPTLTQVLLLSSNFAWLRAVLPVHPTSWLTPCLLPVAANTLRENQHETHVIQRHPRRRNACSHR